jgi:hypothetical protein
VAPFVEYDLTVMRNLVKFAHFYSRLVKIMGSKFARNCEVLRTRFEGREAIYLEKGALRGKQIEYSKADKAELASVLIEIQPGGKAVATCIQPHLCPCS